MSNTTYDVFVIVKQITMYISADAHYYYDIHFYWDNEYWRAVTTPTSYKQGRQIELEYDQNVWIILVLA